MKNTPTLIIIHYIYIKNKNKFKKFIKNHNNFIEKRLITPCNITFNGFLGEREAEKHSVGSVFCTIAASVKIYDGTDYFQSKS